MFTFIVVQAKDHLWIQCLCICTNAMKMEVIIPVIAQSVMQLIDSRDNENSCAKAIAMMRHGFGGHPFGEDDNIKKERATGQVEGFYEKNKAPFLNLILSEKIKPDKMAYSSIVYYLFALLTIPFVSANAQLNNPRYIPYNWKTDTSKKTVLLSEFTVAVPKGAFAVLNHPKFIKSGEGLQVYFKHEPVISISIKGQAKAYPLSILTVHEIANDTLNGHPILVTYCPLCNASVVYDRRMHHKGKDHLLHFSVSGMLRNSDMVMFDTQTETWWQQLMGEALVGELSGAELTIIPSLLISMEEFIKRYPDGQILFAKNRNCRSRKKLWTEPLHWL